MDPDFVRQVIQNQAPMPTETIYTIEDVKAADVVTVRVVSRGAGDEVCGYQEIKLDADDQKNLRTAATEADHRYTTCTYYWQISGSGVEWSNALDKITLTKTANVVRVEDCKSRLDGSKSTVYFMKLLDHIIKTSGHDGQYVYVLPYIYIRASSHNITLTVDKGPMDELHQTMKWICLTFRSPPEQPCFSFENGTSRGKFFRLKPLLPATNPDSSEFCQKLFDNAVIACGQSRGTPQNSFFFLDMPFGELKTRTGCERPKEFHGGIVFEGRHGTLIPTQYTPDYRSIIWCFEGGQGEQHEDRVLEHIMNIRSWLGPRLMDPRVQATQLVDEKRVLVYGSRPLTP
ncbi:hypothetical protein ABOM_005655 [Aspergillus bombycis]|uniref:Uncharacterized protein n=1 Tax=Aspergillus bombycis TaxID=109264 RepID=A0A1F8A2U6_9EURO|nr:hypothetical protein ABOM_005655 [Aspergillus bombycis]OGM46031.1 hypothetical protein ABOM_005655 [Aspergillus bombycis]